MRRHRLNPFHLLLPAALLLLPGAAWAQSGGGSYAAFHGTWASAAPAVTMTWEDRGGGIVYVSTTDLSLIHI